MVTANDGCSVCGLIQGNKKGPRKLWRPRKSDTKKGPKKSFKSVNSLFEKNLPPIGVIDGINRDLSRSAFYGCEFSNTIFALESGAVKNSSKLSSTC